MAKLKIKKGDRVKVITGKNKGKVGEIIRVIPSTSKVVVSGVNLVKKHTKPTQFNEGGIIQKELPIHVSNVSMLDPKTSEITKVGFRVSKEGKKERFAKKSKELLSTEGK